VSRERRKAFKRFLLPAALVFVAALAILSDGSAQASAQPPCADADRAPGRLTLHTMRSTVLCLVNRVRGHYKLAPLASSPELRGSATGHSADMVARHYFAHDGPRGGTLGDRIGRAGYLSRPGGFLIGENIGGGIGARFGSPAAVYRAWMRSPPHRFNILNPDFHDVGVGVVRGFPDGGGGAAATYTMDFGARH
jgi:uncharacterized protein YkwD